MQHLLESEKHVKRAKMIKFVKSIKQYDQWTLKLFTIGLSRRDRKWINFSSFPCSPSLSVKYISDKGKLRLTWDNGIPLRQAFQCLP